MNDSYIFIFYLYVFLRFFFNLWFTSIPNKLLITHIGINHRGTYWSNIFNL